MNEWARIAEERLDGFGPVERVRLLSQWIPEVSVQLVGALADMRRQAVVELLDSGFDAHEVAGMVGIRVSTVRRLASDGRRVAPTGQVV